MFTCAELALLLLTALLDGVAPWIVPSGVAGLAALLLAQTADYPDVPLEGVEAVRVVRVAAGQEVEVHPDPAHPLLVRHLLAEVVSRGQGEVDALRRERDAVDPVSRGVAGLPGHVLGGAPKNGHEGEQSEKRTAHGASSCELKRPPAKDHPRQ